MFVRLLLLFTVVPLIELWLLIRLDGVIGFIPTIAIVLLTGAVGATIARWQGLATLRRVREEMSAGRVPTVPLVDGLLILVAAAVLITPGLLTDTIGFLLLIPPTRAAVRRGLVEAFRRRMQPQGPVIIETAWSPGGDPKSVGGSDAKS